jgi:hypothetical protein
MLFCFILQVFYFCYSILLYFTTVFINKYETKQNEMKQNKIKWNKINKTKQNAIKYCSKVKQDTAHSKIKCD